MQQSTIWPSEFTCHETPTDTEYRSWRLVTDHVTLLLFHPHWLPISYCITFKILFLTFQCLYGQAPTYLIDLITIKKQSRYSLRTSESIYFLSYLALRPVPPLAIVHSSQLHLISGSITFGNLQHKDIGHF